MAILKYLSKLLSRAHHSATKLQPNTSTAPSLHSSTILVSRAAKRSSQRRRVRNLNTVGSSDLIATATIINHQQRVSKVVESYTTTYHKDTTGTTRSSNNNNNNKLTPIAESSSSSATAISSTLDVEHSLCTSCDKNYDLICKRFCKCCGKDMMRRRRRRCGAGSVVASSGASKRRHTGRAVSPPQHKVSTTHCFVRTSSEFRKDTTAKLRCNLFESAAASGGSEELVYRATRQMKKSKVDVSHGVERVEYRSFLTNAKKYSSTVSSTIQEVRKLKSHHGRTQLAGLRCNQKQLLVEEALGKLLARDKTELRSKSSHNALLKILPTISEAIAIKNYEDRKLAGAKIAVGSEVKAGSTFLVDFASTPIKLAPKTSTPIKGKCELKSE